MTAEVVSLWRHPIKSHGREPLESVTLTEGQTFPWDRVWAVTHDQTRDDPCAGWISSRNFQIGTLNPGLAGIWATLDETRKAITLTRADVDPLTIIPDAPEATAQLAAWLETLSPPLRTEPRAIVRNRPSDQGWTDTNYPTVSIMNRASHRAVEQAFGHPVEEARWRGNIWLDGLSAWEEMGWIGKVMTIGTAQIEIREPIKRCLHTSANPTTGERDFDMLGVLKTNWGHTDFGVYGVVLSSGSVTIGDEGYLL